MKYLLTFAAFAAFTYLTGAVTLPNESYRLLVHNRTPMLVSVGVSKPKCASLSHLTDRSRFVGGREMIADRVEVSDPAACSPAEFRFSIVDKDNFARSDIFFTKTAGRRWSISIAERHMRVEARELPGLLEVTILQVR